MPLDEYKTQVLLLHSEQSTLDTYSSGFTDRYTVHCATTGSEALNTLVETPINIIVTAQDLPGMSGLDALREAKKRSPDTIGILLAGNNASNIEALVGAEEVFQVVRGQISNETLLKLVDNATRQMRLMALTESANDTTANVDEPAEHIIMETSENGATIITDATGRMPKLDPKKVSASAAAGSRSVDVLVLTKDEEFLQTIKESSRGMHKVYYANTLSQANDAIGKHKIGVAVVDAAMVGDKIEQLTQHLRKGSPRLVSIVAGRRDDGEMLMDLINRGKVYRFLLKPVSPGRARLAVESSVKHHLEAPDSAFKSKGLPAAAKVAPTKPATPKPAAKQPIVKPVPAPVPTPAPSPTPPAAAKPAPRGVDATGTYARPTDVPLGSMTSPDSTSPMDAGLGDAFGGDETSFTETVTGLVSSVAERFSAEKPGAAESSAPTQAKATKSTASGSGGWLKKNGLYLGIGAAVLVLVTGGLYWLTGDNDNAGTVAPSIIDRPAITESDVVFDAAPPSAEIVDVEPLIEEARLARDAGQVFNPAGNNAIELYAAALAADPQSSAAAVELAAVIETALAMAESALLETRLDDAAAALERVALVDAENVRLPFLTVQLSQMQLRSRLDSARSAIRESRFEDAAAAINSARSLGITDTGELDIVAAELSNARSEQRVDDVLAQAAARLDAGALISPANDNARYYYELVLSSEPDNASAQQGLGVVAGRLAFLARTEIDNGDLEAAEEILADARAVDPENAEVDATITALANAHAEAAEQARRAAAARAERVATEKAAAEKAAAEKLAAEQAAAEKLAADKAAAEKLAAEQAAAEQRSIDATADAPVAADSAPQEVATVDSDASEELAPTAAENVQAATVIEAVADDRPVPVSTLSRTRYVAPKYPRAAERRNLSGWVDVVFTVATDGTVSGIEIRNSEPGDMFVSAAIKAVEKWEFEPIIEDGAAVEKRAGVRMMFALE